MKKILYLVGLTALAVAVVWARFFFVSPGAPVKESSKNLYRGKIIIGTETWPGNLPLYVAQEKGYFSQAGLDVEIKRYVALGELSRDYRARRMQGRTNLNLDAINETLDGVDHRTVLMIDYSSGADAIIARPPVQSLRDLAGKKIGYEAGTLEEFFLSWVLEKNGLKLSDVVTVNANPEEAVHAYEEGRVDAMVTHEPFLSRVLGAGNARVLFSSADAPGLIVDLLTFHADFILTYPETVQAIVLAYFRAFHFWQEHPLESYAILAREFGGTVEEISAQMKGIQMMDERENQTAFTFSSGLESLCGNLRQTGKFVRLQRNIALKQLDTDSLIEDRFVRHLDES